MSHLGLCRSGLSRIRDYVAFGINLFEIMSFRIVSHSGLCRLRDYVAFGIMSFGIMSHSGLCRIRDYVAFGLMSVEIMSFGLMLFGIMSVYHNFVRRSGKFKELK